MRTSRLIRAQIDYSKDDRRYLAINESRRAAMCNVWLLLIWLVVAAVESFTYSLAALLTAPEDCLPEDTSQSWRAILQFVDRTCTFQSWFVPLIWLYWPTKARKRENRSRKRAIDQLHKTPIQSSSDINDSPVLSVPNDGDDDFSDDGYSDGSS